jgi:MoaA/NifB/PqqE/SkfB family radical SAM enzyme
MTNKCAGLCILPWIHASIGTTGAVFPCCRVICFEPDQFGNLNHNNLESIRQNKTFTEFRQMMLEGQSPVICKGCYQEESSGISSLRQQFNNEYPDLVEKVISENKTEALPLRYAEVRFSNQCNLSCRTCHLEFSSSWHKDHEALYGKAQKIIYPHADKEEGLLGELEAALDSIDMIYIAGGEPLIQKQHYDMLEMLIRKNRTDIKLVYDTNLTKLSFGKKSVLNLWKHFKFIQVNGSIDGVKERFDLIRHGESWSTVERNIQIIRMMLPHISLVLSPTISVLNVAHLPEMIDYCLQKKLIPNLSHLRFNFLYEPYHYQINSLPLHAREPVLNKLEAIIAREMKTNEKAAQSLIPHVEHMRKAFEIPLVENQLHLFKDFTLKLDNLRDEKTSHVCPELSELLD